MTDIHDTIKEQVSQNRVVLYMKGKEFSNWPTVPQLYVDGEFVGGCDIVREMYQTGELQQLLAKQPA